MPLLPLRGHPLAGHPIDPPPRLGRPRVGRVAPVERRHAGLALVLAELLRCWQADGPGPLRLVAGSTEAIIGSLMLAGEVPPA